MQYYGNGSLAAKAVWDSQSQQDWIEYEYDPFGQLAQITYPDEGMVDFSRDKFGRPTLIHDDRNSSDYIGGTGAYEGLIDYDFDPLNRVLRRTDQDGYQVEYTWSADGQKDSVIVRNSGASVVYAAYTSFDAANRPVDVAANDSAHPGDPEYGLSVASLAYDDKGNRSALTYRLDGTSKTVGLHYSHNRQNQLDGFYSTWQSTSDDVDFSLENVVVDGLGRLAEADETLTQTSGTTIEHSHGYSYDRRSELTTADIGNIDSGTWTAEYTYRYDGNIDQMTIGQTTIDLDYTGDQLTSYGNDSLTWNKNGNLATDAAAKAFTWTWDQQLRRAEWDNAGQTDGIACRYAPDGSRTQRDCIIDSQVDSSIKYICDTVGKYPVVLMELDPNTMNILRSYIQHNGQTLVQYDGDMDDDKAFLLHDRLGSVRMAVDEAGNILAELTYDPWGNELESDFTTGFDTPFRFANYAWDDVLGQYFCNARWYDPVLARFTGRDPVRGDFREPLTLHAYLYCANNPINAVDPTGRSAMLDVLSAMADRADEDYATANVACRGLWAIRNIIRAAELVNATKSLIIAAEMGVSAMKAVGTWLYMHSVQGAVWGGRAVLGWTGFEINDPGVTNDLIGFIVGDPHLPSSRTGTYIYMVYETAKTLKDYLGDENRSWEE